MPGDVMALERNRTEGVSPTLRSQLPVAVNKFWSLRSSPARTGQHSRDSRAINVAGTAFGVAYGIRTLTLSRKRTNTKRTRTRPTHTHTPKHTSARISTLASRPHKLSVRIPEGTRTFFMPGKIHGQMSTNLVLVASEHGRAPD